MMKTIQRVGTAIGILAACFLIWFAIDYRSVDQAVLLKRIADQEASLASRAGPDPSGDDKLAPRVAFALAKGARFLAFEEANAATGTALDLALERMKNRRDVTSTFTAADRDLILDQRPVQIALKELAKQDSAGLAEARQNDRPIAKALALNTYLSLALSRAVDAGDEERVIAHFETLTRWSYRLLGSEDTTLRLAGATNLRTLPTAAQEVSIPKTVLGPESAVEALLLAVPSAAGRQRLVAAIDLALDRTPNAEQTIVAEFRSLMRTSRLNIEQGFTGKDSIPRTLDQDFAAIIVWQNNVLELLDQPAFVPSEAAFAPAARAAESLPGEAKFMATRLWPTVRAFQRGREEVERLRRWLAAGTTD